MTHKRDGSKNNKNKKKLDTHLILLQHCAALYRCLYLFLVLILHAQPLFDAVASLQECLPLGSFCQDAHKQSWQVDTGEQHCVGNQLQAEKNMIHCLNYLAKILRTHAVLGNPYSLLWIYWLLANLCVFFYTLLCIYLLIYSELLHTPKGYMKLFWTK